MNFDRLDSGSLAGDVTKTWTIPGNIAYKVLYGHCHLTAVGAAARYLKVAVYDSNDEEVWSSHAGKDANAAGDYHYSLKQGVGRETAFQNNEIEMSLPVDGVIPSTWYIKAEVINGTASDTWRLHLAIDKKSLSAF